MGRTPCCDKMQRRRGPWTSEEDQILITHIMNHGHGNWRVLPKQAGLLRCGKSCRLRWTNFLRPGIRRGNFTPQEVQTIIQLHQVLGNRWSLIASYLPGRTDSDIKNMWNAHLKKRLESKAERKLYTTSDTVQPCTAGPIAFPTLGCNLLQSSDSSRHSKDRQSETLLPCDYDACNAKNNPEFINGESSFSTVTDDGKTGGQQNSDHHAEPPNILINEDKLSHWQPPVVDEMVFWKTQKFGEHDNKLLQHHEYNTALYELEDGTAATATGLSWQIIPCCPSQDTGTNDVVDQLPARSDDYCEHRGIEQIISDESSISCQANPHITSSHFAGPHPLPCVPDDTMDVAYFDELWVDFQRTGAIDYSVNFWN